MAIRNKIARLEHFTHGNWSGERTRHNDYLVFEGRILRLVWTGSKFVSWPNDFPLVKPYLGDAQLSDDLEVMIRGRLLLPQDLIQNRWR